MKTYRLGSNPMVSAPGMVRWAINGAKFPRDRTTMVNVIAQTWNIPAKDARKLLLCEVPHSVEDETVVFSV